MADTYPSTQVAAQGDPANDAIAIDYSGGDQTITGNARALYITTAGTLKVDTAAGRTVTLPFITGIAPLKVTKIYQTGSSAAAGQIWF